jgi:hypothetical protein
MLFDGGPRFIFRVTDIFQRTFRALGIAGNTDGTSVMNYLVREEDPTVARDDLHQVLFDSRRIIVLREF